MNRNFGIEKEDLSQIRARDGYCLGQSLPKNSVCLCVKNCMYKRAEFQLWSSTCFLVAFDPSDSSDTQAPKSCDAAPRNFQTFNAKF